MKLNVLSLLFSIMLCLPFGISAQRTAFSILANSGTENQADYLTSGPKYEKALEIYNKLVDAKGDRRFPAPAFVMSNSTRNVAYVEADYLSIGLEEKAYDIFMGLGKKAGENAIAAVLGHELSHFFEKHQWRGDILGSYKDEILDKNIETTAKALDKVENGQQISGDLYNAVEGTKAKLVKFSNETQSDYLGGFLAYSAGFDVFQDLPKMYDKIYDGYGFNDSIPGYATRNERKAMAEQSLERVNDFVDLFEVANLLIAIDRFSDARLLYRYILQEYQSREIYNNLGVLTMFEAMEYFGDNAPETKYQLPIQLELNFSKSARGGAGEVDIEKLRKELLEEAIGYFDSAIGLDPTYPPAYQNKACAYYLLNDFTRATFYAETEAIIRAQADTIQYGKTAIDAEVLLGLIKISTGKIGQGTKQLGQLRQKSSIAKTNFRIAKNLPPLEKASEDGPEWEIDGADDAYIKARRASKSKDLNIFEADKLRVYDEKEDGLENSKIYRFKPRAGDERPDVYFMITDPGYPGETWDEFKVGSRRNDIVKEYGRPNSSLETVNGEMMVYESMILIMDANRRLSRWVLFVQK